MVAVLYLQPMREARERVASDKRRPVLPLKLKQKIIELERVGDISTMRRTHSPRVCCGRAYRGPGLQNLCLGNRKREKPTAFQASCRGEP
jgi:hypothetical protein